MKTYLETLNENQRKAVAHIDGPCLVIAGAGSGKTKVLTTRIASLIEMGVPSWNILAITFTNKAAKEMRERLNVLVPSHQAFVGTFHSLGIRIIRENVEQLNLDRNFTILDSDDVTSIIRKLLKDKGYNPKDYSPSYIKNRISFIKNEMLNDREIDAFFNTPAEKVAKDIYYAYLDKLALNNSVDFDDLLRLPVELFLKHPDILEHYQDKFKYILIDEYQDTNEVQYKLSKLLARKHQNIFVVGDSNQAIYAFRGSNYKNILNFEKDYKNAKVITLNQNYRSTETILNAANSVIKNNKERKDFELFSDLGKGLNIKYTRAYDEKHEIKQVIDYIKELLNEGFSYSDIGVLYRTNGQARIVEEQFLAQNIPYKVVGSYYFYARKEIKDLLAYLRLILNHNDEISLRRAINVPKRGIGQKTILALEEKAQEENVSMFEAISKGKELEFKNLILKLAKESENVSLTELIDLILEQSGMQKELVSTPTLENELRLENLMEFKSITASFEEQTGNVNLGDFLEEISLVADISEHKQAGDEVTLMTIHSAKGLEFEVVFLVGMEENIFPHVNSMLEPGGLEEERRLCYVGITRAKQRLYISNAKRRMLYGKDSMNMPSRFIKEIDKKLIDEDKTITLEVKEKLNKSSLYNNAQIDYKAGDVVMHTIYGRGVVVEVRENILTIAFAKNFGIKKLLKNHKSLKKMS